MNLPLISIIIPVYNAEHLLIKCLDSLKNQTYGSLEFIFVNDCSKDDSLCVLNNFRFQLTNFRPEIIVKIVNHQVNQGVAAARNSGLEVLTGDYVYYLDADDYLAYNAIEILVNSALNTGADVVGCNWILKFDKKGRTMSQPLPGSPIQAIEFMAKGIMRWNLWLFLVKRELYDNFQIRFSSGQNMGEDLMVQFKLLVHANKISMVQESLYYYSQSNNQSLTKVYSDKHRLEVSSNLIELNDYFVRVNKINNWDELFNFLKLNIKLPLLISNCKQEYKDWANWFSESNSYCLNNNLLSRRIKFLQYAAWKRQYWLLRLHYYFIVRVIYGLIYN